MNINAKIPLVKVPEGYPNTEELYLQYTDRDGVKQLQLRLDHAVQDYAIGLDHVLHMFRSVSGYIDTSESALLYEMIVRN